MNEASTSSHSSTLPQRQGLIRKNIVAQKYQTIQKVTLLERFNKNRHRNIICGIIVTVLLLCIWQSAQLAYQDSDSEVGSTHIRFHTQDSYIGNKFPKIVWIEKKQDILGTLLSNHLQDVFSRRGYSVRFIDGLSAYDWLSQKMIDSIRSTKHGSHFEVKIQELLKLGVLIEHGGIYIENKDILFIDDVKWIQSYITDKLKTLEENRSSQIFMLHNMVEHQIQYYDNIIFAAKGSALLQRVMVVMSKLLTLDNKDLKEYILQKKTNPDTLAQSYPNFIQAIINHEYKLHANEKISFQSQYRIITMSKDSPQLILKANPQSLTRILISDKVQIQKEYGTKRILMSQGFGIVSDFAIKFINNIKMFIPHENSILKTKIMDVQGNSQIFTSPDVMRDVNFCIVSLEPLAAQNYSAIINNYLKKLSLQTYEKWKAAFFIQNVSKQQNDFKNSFGKTVKIINGSKMQGLNLQRALTKFCHPKDITILLNHDEQFGMSTDLQKIKHKIEPKNVYGVFLGISESKSGKFYEFQVNRSEQVQRKGQANNEQIYTHILNHFRVFSVESYLFLPHFELHDINGNYYKRQIPLVAMNQIFQNYGSCDKNVYRYLLFKIDKIIDTPWYRESAKDISIVTNWYTYPRCDGYQYNEKYRVFNLCEGIQYQWMGKRLPFHESIALNDGKEFEGIEQRKKRVKNIVPKITHQVWFGGEIPEFKRILINRLRQYLPKYNHMLWTKDNITLQNFPYTYQTIQSLLQFNKNSPYNKLSLISDLIRFEAVYNFGGFYVDTNYMLLKPNGLDDFLSYQFIISPYFTPTHMGVVQGGFYGAIKNYKPILNVLNHQSLSTRNIFSKQAHFQLGPHYFSWMLSKQDVNNENILMLPMEYIYPYFPYFNGRVNLCFADKQTDPSNILLSHKQTYIKNCNEKYPYAYGIDLYDEGASWMNRN